MGTYHLITGEYPPRWGGVGDYTQLVAGAFAARGAEVHVWTPATGACSTAASGVVVHSLPDSFGPGALRIMDRELRSRRGDRIIVQYVPHAYGYRAMNLMFCAWLLTRHALAPDVIFHEVAFPFRHGQPARQNFLALVNRAMALMVARGAARIFVSTPAWEKLLHPMISAAQSIEWLPLPSNIPVVADCATCVDARSRLLNGSRYLVGHFGTYGAAIVPSLASALVAVLSKRCDTSATLIGNGSRKFLERFVEANPSFGSRISATGALDATSVSAHIGACDVMIQPYPDGATTRRTSLMAAIAHGVATVTIAGESTESIWHESRAVSLAPAGDGMALGAAAAWLLGDRCAREQIARAGRELYAARFDIGHTIDALTCKGSQTRRW